MNAIFDCIFGFFADMYLKYLGTLAGCEFENVFFTILPRHILYMVYPFGHLYGRTYQAQLPSKHMRTETVLHLIDSLNVPLNLKENCTRNYAFS